MNAFWAARSPREKTILAGGGAFLGAALLVAFAWLPLERSRTRLASEMPRLAASVAAMERQAAEVVRVRSLPATAASAASPTSAIAAALGTRLPGVQATPVDDKRVRVSSADVAYGALLEAIASAQGSYGMRVDSARIDALPAAGRVRAEVLLTRS